MTTICYRDGIMAADTRAYSGHSTPIGLKRKIYKRADGALIGVSTNAPGLSELVGEWFLDDKNRDLEPQLGHEQGIDAIEVDAHGNVFVYHDSMNPTGPLQAPFFAVGSGANYAIGALTLGATALEAVDVAIEHDVWSGGPVNALEHGRPKSVT